MSNILFKFDTSDGKIPTTINPEQLNGCKNRIIQVNRTDEKGNPIFINGNNLIEAVMQLPNYETMLPIESNNPVDKYGNAENPKYWFGQTYEIKESRFAYYKTEWGGVQEVLLKDNENVFAKLGDVGGEIFLADITDKTTILSFVVCVIPKKD